MIFLSTLPGWTCSHLIYTSVLVLLESFKASLKRVEDGCGGSVWRCVRERSPSGQITDRELGLNTLRTRAKHFKCECYKSPTARKGTSFSPLLLSPQFPLPPSLPTVIAFSFVSELSPSIPYLSISLSPYSSPLPLTKTVGRLTLITVRFPPSK